MLKNPQLFIQEKSRSLIVFDVALLNIYNHMEVSTEPSTSFKARDNPLFIETLKKEYDEINTKSRDFERIYFY